MSNKTNDKHKQHDDFFFFVQSSVWFSLQQSRIKASDGLSVIVVGLLLRLCGGDGEFLVRVEFQQKIN